MLPIVEQALKHCQFYAFDCEMTGLKHTYNDSISYFADMQERYAQVRSLAEQPHKLMLTRFAMTSHCKGFCSVLQLQPPSPAACTATFCCSPMQMHVMLNAGCSQRQGLLALPVWVVSLLLAGRQIRGPDLQLPLVPQVMCTWCLRHTNHLSWTLSCFATGHALLVCTRLSCLQHPCTLLPSWACCSPLQPGNLKESSSMCMRPLLCCPARVKIWQSLGSSPVWHVQAI